MQPIGIIHSPFQDLKNMPIQPKGAPDAEGRVVVDPAYAPGLKDLDGFSHIYLIYHCHKAARTELTVVPFLDTVERGVYATRSPLRPNHIGLSVVNLTAVEDNVLTVRGIDVLDGTPLLDIKPYVGVFDAVPDSRSGWIKARHEEVRRKRSDDRFV